MAYKSNFCLSEIPMTGILIYIFLSIFRQRTRFPRKNWYEPRPSSPGQKKEWKTKKSPGDLPTPLSPEIAIYIRIFLRSINIYRIDDGHRPPYLPQVRSVRIGLAVFVNTNPTMRCNSRGISKYPEIWHLDTTRDVTAHCGDSSTLRLQNVDHRVWLNSALKVF